MKKNNPTPHTFCTNCLGFGKVRLRPKKKERVYYQKQLELYENNNQKGEIPILKKGALITCKECNGTGLIKSKNYPKPNSNLPHIAIIGAGIGGAALAVACLHRGIPFTLYEKDSSFDSRSQGYGLTLQQASKAIKALGIETLKEGIVSNLHIVHHTNGTIIGEWGMRKWLQENPKYTPRRTNVHIARQSLRLALLKQLSCQNNVQWYHQLIDYKDNSNQEIELNFNVNGKIKTYNADLIVGTDGIRSTLRNLLIEENQYPLQYLNCMVVLGICALKDIQTEDRTLLDSETVFQTANGKERIYMMPYDKNSIMWQLSFPIPEEKAKKIHTQGADFLKKEAQKRTPWHAPIPNIIEATKPEFISGYPVYDRDILKPESLENANNATLLGDAAHPMSPFKGQGANQALLDALSLARLISRKCNAFSGWKEKGLRKSVLTEFEAEMLARSAQKVKDSAQSAKFLHTKAVLEKANKPRSGGF